MTRILAEFAHDELRELRDALDQTYGRQPARITVQDLRRKVNGLLLEAEFVEHQQAIADSYAIRQAEHMGFRRAG